VRNGAEKVRVLLVEDHPVNQTVVTRLLERLGCVVDVAEDGLYGLEMCERGGYALVLMDCSMPRMDGFEATRSIRALAGSVARTPIVALTAHATLADRARCLEAGMDAWLPKPVSPEDLAGALARFTSWRPMSDASLDGVLDERVVRQLVDLAGPDDPEFFSNLVRDFQESGVRTLLEARAHREARRLEEARRSMHRLKSASATVGAVRLGEVCGRFEAAADDALGAFGAELLDLAEMQMQIAASALSATAASAA
jgi:two-component system sensor histidine kinase/response regulator